MENYGVVLIRSFGSFAEYTCFWKISILIK